MTNHAFEFLLRAYRDRRIDRRQFMQRAAALGASASAAGAFAVAGPGARVRATKAQEGETGGLVTVSTEQFANWEANFNPFAGSDGPTRFPTHAGIYEPLIVYNLATAEIVPWLATGYAFSPDNTQLTFTIRQGVSWSDGQPFGANDVVFTFSTLRENAALPGFGAIRGVLDDYITAIESPDAETVVFTFSKPYTPGLYDIGHQSIVPEHIFSTVDDLVTFTNDKPVGTGPFTEVPVFRDNIYEVHRNPNYWQEGKPYIQGFRFPIYPSNDAANLATTNGENDWAANFIPDIEATYVAKDPENYGYWFPAFGAPVHLYTNTTRAPFDDPNVRKAISMALNRDQIVEIAMYDYTHPSDSTGLSDAFDTWRNADAAGAEWVTYNVDRANELLDAAGLTRDGDVRTLPDGGQMSYDINVVSGWSDWVQACDIMAQNLSEVGIQAQVQPYDFGAWFERVQQGDFDLSIGWSSGGSTPFNFYRGVMATATKLELGEAANENWHRFADERADALLDQFAATSDLDEQKRIGNELQVLYAENAPAIPLFPGPMWGESNTTRFTDFPSEENPYAVLSSWQVPDRIIVLTTIKPVEGAE